jgi:hypothetical protein
MIVILQWESYRAHKYKIESYWLLKRLVRVGTYHSALKGQIYSTCNSTTKHEDPPIHCLYVLYWVLETFFILSPVNNVHVCILLVTILQLD